MRREIERLLSAHKDELMARFEPRPGSVERLDQAIADLEAVLIPDGYVAVSRSMAMRLIRDGGHLTNAELIDLRMELTQAPPDAATAEDIEGNDPDSCNDHEPLQETSTAKCPGSIMPRVNGKPFRCECGCNVFTELNNFYRCNACSLEYEGTGVASTGKEMG